ncbi:MAG: NAD-dependent epimerase [Hyphomicrobiaceae bacterium]
MRVLVTGAAGFVGFHTAGALLARGEEVLGLDNLSTYYDVRLKEARLERLSPHAHFRFEKADLADRTAIERLFADWQPESVVHLGAQAGVRYSLTHPHAYAASNIAGFLHILEGCRTAGVRHLVYASSSSVYGDSTAQPFSVGQTVDHPLSLYAASKKSNEAMAHAYAHLYGLPATGLRFFTVYGPWGRPDMAYFKFTKAIFAGEPIDVYNNGRHARDLTYIDDVVAGVLATLDRPATPDPAWSADRPNPATSTAPYRLYNIGNDSPVELLDLIACIERATGRTARKRLLPLQPGDVPRTWANVDALVAATGFRPATPIDVGIARFVAWYRTFYGIS